MVDKFLKDEVIRRYLIEKQPVKKICNDLRIGKTTLYKILKKENIERNREKERRDKVFKVEKAVLEAFKSGKSIVEICKDYGISKPTIYKILKKHDVELRRKAITEEEIALINKLREEGKGIREIAKETGRSTATIQKFIMAVPRQIQKMRGLYYKAVYFHKMGYVEKEISEILGIPISTIKQWVRGISAPIGALKIPATVIRRRVGRYDYPVLTERKLVLYSGLLGISMGDARTSILYFRRLDRGDTYGNFEYTFCLEVKSYDFAYLASLLLSKLSRVRIGPEKNEKQDLWQVKIKNKDIVCFLIEHGTTVNRRLRKIVEENTESIKSWLYFFKLSEGKRGRHVSNTNKEFLLYFKELENCVGIHTDAEPIWHNDAWQLYVPKKFDIIVGDTSRDQTKPENWPLWLRKALQ